MTREEREDAIKFFEEVARKEINNAKYSKLAIEALEQQPVTTTNNDEPITVIYPTIVCDDAISRQAVLDLATTIQTDDYSGNEILEVVDVDDVKALPPVNPQQKHEDVAKAFQLGVAFGFGEKHDEMDKVIEEVKKAIEPKPKTGRWKVVSDGYGDRAYICECSECKDTVWVYKNADRKWNYCPSCGAKMVEPQESEE